MIDLTKCCGEDGICFASNVLRHDHPCFIDGMCSCTLAASVTDAPRTKFLSASPAANVAQFGLSAN